MRHLALSVWFTSLSLCAQATWQQLPAPFTFNQFYPVSFDTLRGELHLCDPGWGHWVFDGVQWLSRPAAPVYGFEMAYDPVRDRTVVVGATGGAIQTWGFDGAVWGQLAAQAPFPQPHGLVWHAQRQTIVAFSNAGLHEWNGVAWLAVPSLGTPPVAPGVHGLDMHYDGLRNVVVVALRVGAAIGAVWEWQATSGWVQVVAGSSFGAAMAHFGFDPIRFRQVAIVRPTTSTAFTADEVWERVAGTAASWTLRGVTPSPTGDGPVVWDPVQARLLIVSWYIGGPMLAYTGTNPALYHVHGSGCTGLGSFFDSLHATAPAAMPYAGQTFVAEVSPTSALLGVLVTGLSDQTASGAPLPLSLAALGMGNCLLRVSPDLLTVLAPAGAGVLQSGVVLGTNPAALGLEFFQQALIFRAGANPFGAVMTNSTRGVIGLP